MKAFTLEDFLAESNRIEGIHEPPTTEQMVAAEHFLGLSSVAIEDLVVLAEAITGRKDILREHEGMNVRVGDHRPIRGGEGIPDSLETLLDVANESALPGLAYEIHRCYETLHPFMDGNGRTGRLLWLWMLGGIEKAPLGFLHTWYYQSLQHGR